MKFRFEKRFEGRRAPDEVKEYRIPLRHAGFEFEILASGRWLFKGSDIDTTLDTPKPVVGIHDSRVKLDAFAVLDATNESALTVVMMLEGAPVEYPEGEEQDDASGQ